MSEGKIKLGICSCLIGEHVLFGGVHLLNRYLVETLGRFVKWIPVPLFSAS